MYKIKGLNFIRSMWDWRLAFKSSHITRFQIGRDAMYCVSAFFFTFAEISFMKSGILSDKEIRIMAGQIQLPEVGIAGQEKIKNARILVIGAGGKGTSVLQSLVAAGVGTIGITDNILVEEDILPRQSLYGEKDLGKQRAIISAHRLSESGCSSAFTLHNICLMETNILDIIAPYDLLVDATDNFPAHYMINDAAIISGKPFVYGSVNHNAGFVSVFNLPAGPSFRCLYPQRPRSKTLLTDEGLPALNILYQVTGSLMACEALKIIQGIPSAIHGRLLRFHLDTYSVTFETITRKEENFQIKSF
jgi:molybdopterin/thiamine biosynthesis adenylyltransferase